MSTWFARRAFDLVGAIANFYYTRKYGAIARQLGRPAPCAAGERGFIIIQIDGLSYDHLMEAVSAGYMPYLERLLAERRMLVAPWRCGLPTTTPAAQAGLLFGNRFDIPGFRWYEKERQQVVSVRRPDQMHTLRTRISQGRPGILRGGSCYVSIFDGDANLALFTLSTFTRRHFFENIRGLGLLLLFFLSPLRILRLAGLVVLNYLAGLSRRLIALLRPGVLNPLDIFSPLLHAVSDVLITEAQTFGVLLDIYRCVPAIYANYNSYDEVAHKLGANHRAAFRVLRGIDKRIHQIGRMCARYRRREYDLYVLSDHGNSPAVPFSWQHKMSLGKYVVSLIGEDVTLDEQGEDTSHSSEKKLYLLEELESLERSLSPRLRRMLRTLRGYADRHTLQGHTPDYDPRRQQDVIVSVSGPLAHIYFNVSPRPLDLIEVILLYPRLVDGLLVTPGIGALAGRAGERTVVLGTEGGIAVLHDGYESVRWPHPLAPFGDAGYWAAQIHHLAHFPHAGDIIVLGGVEPDGRMVTFEEQVATHGGPGGAQGRPFIAWPAERPLAPEKLNDAQELYSYFRQVYLEGEMPHL